MSPCARWLELRGREDAGKPLNTLEPRFTAGHAATCAALVPRRRALGRRGGARLRGPAR